MNSKLMKAGLAGAAAIALAAGGGTFASWSDFHTWSGNHAGAGTLTLSTNTPDSQTFNVGNLIPGGVWTEDTYLLSNKTDSTPNGNLFVSLAGLTGHEDGCMGNTEAIDQATDADGSCNSTDSNYNPNGQFPSDAKIFIKTLDASETTCGVAPGDGSEKAIYGVDPGAADQSQAKSLADLQAAGPQELLRFGVTDPALFHPGEGVCVETIVYLPKDVDNAVQGDSATFDITGTLKQAF